MFAVGKIAGSTLSKFAPVAKTGAKAGLNVGIKGSLFALKMTSSMMSMVGSAVLGGIYLLYQLSK